MMTWVLTTYFLFALSISSHAYKLRGGVETTEENFVRRAEKKGKFASNPSQDKEKKKKEIKGQKEKKETKGQQGKKETKGQREKKEMMGQKEKREKKKDPKKQKKKTPVLYDTDYGPFIDDVFALGLILNSADLLDLKYIIATSEDADLSSKCVAKHLDLAGFSSIPVGSGQVLPPYSERGSVGAIPGFVGFTLKSKCEDVDLPYDKDGVLEAANMIMESKRDDWWYIIVGGQSSAKALIERFPEAAKKIETVVIMGGNWCSGFEPYPNVMAPTDETNIGYDPHAANFILDNSVSPFKNIYYVPVEVADIISGDDYVKFVDAANSGSNEGAAVTLDFYKEWSAAGRANPDVLVHLEAMGYDPETQSTPQFDPCAIMLALELLNKDCEDRLVLVEIDGVRFMEAGEGVAFPDSPRPAFSLLPKSFEMDKLPDQCPALTPYTFDPAETAAVEKRVSVALGYKSAEAKASFFAEMAARMAGETIDKCI